MNDMFRFQTRPLFHAMADAKEEAPCVFIVSAGDFRPQLVGVFSTYDKAIAALGGLSRKAQDNHAMTVVKKSDREWRVACANEQFTIDRLTLDVMDEGLLLQNAYGFAVRSGLRCTTDGFYVGAKRYVPEPRPWDVITPAAPVPPAPPAPMPSASKDQVRA